MKGNNVAGSIIEVGLLGNASNAAVIHLPGRRFPGILIQGDTLRNLLQMAVNVADKLEPGSPERDGAEELRVELQAKFDEYDRCLRSLGLDLPYSG